VTQFRHDRLSGSASGPSSARAAGAAWSAVAGQNLLSREGDYGTLVLTETSGSCSAVTGGHRCAANRNAGAEPASPAAAPAAELPATAAPVFERLRAWRAAAAKEQGVPAYVIFHDATLREIATTCRRRWPSSARSRRRRATSWPATGEQILAALSAA
jgi:ATP-dependent DNA helicase RecQ